MSALFSRPLSRRTAAALLTAASLSAVTACGASSTDSGDASDADADPAPRDVTDQSAGGADSTADSTAEMVKNTEPGVAGTLTRLPKEASLTEVEEKPENLVEVLGTLFRVKQAGAVDSLPKDVVEQFTGITGAFADVVRAADGEQFFVAVITADDARHDVEGDLPETATAIRVGANTLPDGTVPSIEQGDQITVIVSAPKDTQPADLVLEVVQNDKTQALSLVDGTRTESEVEHIYGRPTAVAIGDPKTWSGEFKDYNRNDAHLEGQMDAGVILPAHPKSGWAKPGNVLLGLDITTNKVAASDADLSELVIELEDGSTQKWLEDPKDLFYRFAERVWFEVPADVQKATAKLTAKIKPGIRDVETLDEVAIPLTFTR